MDPLPNCPRMPAKLICDQGNMKPMCGVDDVLRSLVENTLCVKPAQPPFFDFPAFCRLELPRKDQRKMNSPGWLLDFDAANHRL